LVHTRPRTAKHRLLFSKGCAASLGHALLAADMLY
jgi:hypothetical protein